MNFIPDQSAQAFDPHIPTHALYVCLSKMAEKADPPSSSSPLSPSADRWSRHEIPLSRSEGEEVLARRLRRAPPRKPAPVPRHSIHLDPVESYSFVFIPECWLVEFVKFAERS